MTRPRVFLFGSLLILSIAPGTAEGSRPATGLAVLKNFGISDSALSLDKDSVLQAQAIDIEQNGAEEVVVLTQPKDFQVDGVGEMWAKLFIFKKIEGAYKIVFKKEKFPCDPIDPAAPGSSEGAQFFEYRDGLILGKSFPGGSGIDYREIVRWDDGKAELVFQGPLQIDSINDLDGDGVPEIAGKNTSEWEQDCLNPEIYKFDRIAFKLTNGKYAPSDDSLLRYLKKISRNHALQTTHGLFYRKIGAEMKILDAAKFERECKSRTQLKGP